MKKAWKWLKGKKRRIASLCYVAALFIPDPITKAVVAGVGGLLSGKDLFELAQDVKKAKDGKGQK